MKKQTSFKKMLAAISLLTVAVPVSLTVVACSSKNSHQKQLTNSELVVQAINSTTYKLDVMTGFKVKQLKSLVTFDFIKANLVHKISKIFEPEDFTIKKITNHKNEKLLDSNFAEIGMIEAKITFDYAEHENQTTNLIINIHKNKILLSEVFKNFKFVDQKGIEDFLDVSDLIVIIKQLERKLNIVNLDQVGLILQNWTSNSIVIKAKPESKYAGEVTLSWNLKLFEIYGASNVATENEWIKQGLKGYFYLESATNQIKYFDAVWYFHINPGTYHNGFYDYHSFHFINQLKAELTFIFKGYWLTDTVATQFNSFDLTREVRVTVDSPELAKIKVFNKTNKHWENLVQKSKFSINYLGEVKKI